MIQVQDVLEYLPIPEGFDPAHPPPGEYGRRLVRRYYNWDNFVTGPQMAGFNPHVRPVTFEDEERAARYLLAEFGFGPALLYRFGDMNGIDFIRVARMVYNAGDGATPYDLASWADDFAQTMLDVLVLGMAGAQRAHADLIP